ncbi:MAG: translocation/assembly module TamB domain-containing protein [Deltaproteobacteria bacterium]|nr:translocation/assembly module TamB domain-containing protein [Deltaproteobacteria bacterium]MCB9787270.1 translocation/assembly module TamB domain-containing protein [Deltaproteobacteria bacterium]
MTRGVLGFVARGLRLGLKLVFALLVATYLFIVRTFLFALTAVVGLYFAIGTPPVRHLIEGVVADALPGNITFASVQWGPAPGALRVADVSIRGIHGESIITAEAVDAEIDLPAEFAGLVALFVDPHAPIPIRLRAARITGADVVIRLSEDGEVGIERAFVPPPDPDDDSEGRGVTLQIDYALVQRTSARVETPEVSVQVEGFHASTDFSLRDGHLHFMVPHGTAARGSFYLKPGYRPVDLPTRFALPFENFDVRHFRWEGDAFEFLRATADVEGGRLVAGGTLDLEPEEPRWTLQSRVTLPATAPFLADMLGGLVAGEFDVSARGSGTFEQATVEGRLRSKRLEVAGFPLTDVALELGIEPRITPDGRLTHRFLVPEVEANALGGHVAAGPLSFTPRWASLDDEQVLRPTSAALDATLRLESVSPAAVLASDLVGLDLAALPFLGGSLDGTVSLATAADEQTGALSLEVQSQDLTLTWAGLQSLPLARRLAVQGGVRYRSAPPGAEPPTGDRFEAVSELRLDEVVLESADDRVEVDGTLDFAHDLLEGRADVRIADLGAFLAPFGVEGMGGSVTLRQARLGGRLSDPAVSGTVRVVGARVAHQLIGDVEANVELASGLLSLVELRATTPLGRLVASGSLRLWRDSVADLDPRMPFRIEKAQASGLALERILPSLGVSTVLTLDLRRVEGELADPLATLTGSGHVETTELSVGGEHIRRVSADLRADPRRLAVDAIAITLQSGDVVRGDLLYDKRGRRSTLHVRTRDLGFDAFRYFETHEIPFHGTVTADLTVDGRPDDYAVIGTVAVEDFGFDPVALGAARFTLTTAPGGRIDIVADKNFPGIELIDGSFVQLVGGVPTQVAIRTQTGAMDVYETLPFLRIPDTTLRVVSDGLPQGIAPVIIGLDLDLAADPMRWELRVDAVERTLQLGLYDGEIVYTNLSPVYVVLHDEVLDINPLTMGRSNDDALTVCGRLGLDQSIDLRVGGSLDLEVLRPLRELLSVHEGTLVVGNDPYTVDTLGDRRCLPLDDDSVLHLGGTLSAPVASGRLEPHGVRIVPRSLGYSIRLVDGRSVLLRPGKEAGVLRVVFPKDPARRVSGDIDDGTFSLSGELTLRDFAPDTAALHLIGTDIFFSSAGEFRLTFSPEVDLTAQDLSNDERRQMRLSGQVLVTEGTYYKSFDTLTQSITGGSRTGAQIPLTEQVPWLSSLTLALEVSASDFAVRSKLPFGETDLETRVDLSVQGTLDALELYERIELLPGGRVSYDLINREFEVVQGTLDFLGNPNEPELDIEAQTEVTYLALSDAALSDTNEERQVTVSIRITGTPSHLNLELWSNDAPTFDQADLQSLILTGRPKDEAASSQGGLSLRYDFGDALARVLQSPIIDTFSVEVGADASVTAEVASALGHAARLRTRVAQEAEETRVTAGFRFQITDSLSIEGNLQRVQNSTNPSQTYEARFKYRIPLD